MAFIVPIGGGSVGPAIINKLLALGGGKSADIVVLPTAAGKDLVASGQRYGDLFVHEGAGHVRVLEVADRSGADDPAKVAAVRQADVVFFGGGDQTRITAALRGSRMEAALRARLAEGPLVLAGTSAGAAVMGEVMPAAGTGWGAVLRGERGGAAVLDEAREPLVLADGLGFLPGVAVDQHFLARGRFGRLLYTISKFRRRSFIGLGIDESTALVVHYPSLVGEVCGEGAVLLFRASRDGYDNLPEMAGGGAPLATFGLTVDVLAPGCALDVGRGLPIAPSEAAREVAAAVSAGPARSTE